MIAVDAVVRALLPSVKDVGEGSNQLHLKRLWDVLADGVGAFLLSHPTKSEQSPSAAAGLERTDATVEQQRSVPPQAGTQGTSR